MTIEDFDLSPEDNGWVYINNEYIMLLQDREDPYYALPKKMLIGCSCVRKCSARKCKKESMIGNACSRLTCTKCQCFKRRGRRIRSLKTLYCLQNARTI